MPGFSPACLAWFAPPSATSPCGEPGDENLDPQLPITPPRPRDEDVEPSKVSAGKRKRSCASTENLQSMTDAAFSCCSSLRCVEAFVLGGPGADAARLKAEQAGLDQLSTCKARKAFVRAQVPVIKLGKYEGSMVAAGRNVCNKFFSRAFFGVSNNVIESAKNNPSAPSNSPDRR